MSSLIYDYSLSCKDQNSLLMCTIFTSFQSTFKTWPSCDKQALFVYSDSSGSGLVGARGRSSTCMCVHVWMFSQVLCVGVSFPLFARKGPAGPCHNLQIRRNYAMSSCMAHPSIHHRLHLHHVCRIIITRIQTNMCQCPNPCLTA